MRREVQEALRKSSRLFLDLVWPVIASKCGGGEVMPVETIEDNDPASQMDVLAGIDVWQKLRHHGGCRDGQEALMTLSTADDRRTARDTITCWVPDGLEPRAILPQILQDRADDLLWFVSTVTRKMMAGATDKRGFVRLQRRVLQQTMSERTITPIQDALVAAGVVERAGHRAGEYGTGFRLTSPWRSRPVRRVPVTDSRLVARVLRQLESLEQRKLARRLPVHDELDRIQAELLTIGPLADAVVASIADAGLRHRQETLLRRVRGGYRGSRSITGRWFTAFSVCKKILRPFFRFDGEPLGGFDLRCAQPALAAVLLGPQFAQFAQCVGSYCSSHVGYMSCSDVGSLAVLDFSYISSVAAGAPSCGPDLGLFSDLTLSADFYGFMLELARSSGVDLRDPESKGRSELTMIKLLTLKDVLAKKGSYPSDFEDVFRKAFPTVHQAVRWINSHHSPSDGNPRARVHGKLIRILQRLESALVIETVCPPLLDRTPVLPLHDCLFTRLSDIALVEQGFEEAFDRCGVHLGIKRDVPCEQISVN